MIFVVKVINNCGIVEFEFITSCFNKAREVYNEKNSNRFPRTYVTLETEA